MLQVQSLSHKKCFEPVITANDSSENQKIRIIDLRQMIIRKSENSEYRWKSEGQPYREKWSSKNTEIRTISENEGKANWGIFKITIIGPLNHFTGVLKWISKNKKSGSGSIKTRETRTSPQKNYEPATDSVRRALFNFLSSRWGP